MFTIYSPSVFLSNYIFATKHVELSLTPWNNVVLLPRAKKVSQLGIYLGSCGFCINTMFTLPFGNLVWICCQSSPRNAAC